MLPSDSLVFDAPQLCARLGIRYEYAEDEVIFLHRIPRAALRNVSAPSMRWGIDGECYELLDLLLSYHVRLFDGLGC